jgi:hypothetical protein
MMSSVPDKLLKVGKFRFWRCVRISLGAAGLANVYVLAVATTSGDHVEPLWPRGIVFTIFAAATADFGWSVARSDIGEAT